MIFYGVLVLIAAATAMAGYGLWVALGPTADDSSSESVGGNKSSHQPPMANQPETSANAWDENVGRALGRLLTSGTEPSPEPFGFEVLPQLYVLASSDRVLLGDELDLGPLVIRERTRPTAIEELDLPVATYNLLKRRDIHTSRDLLLAPTAVLDEPDESGAFLSAKAKAALRVALTKLLVEVDLEPSQEPGKHASDKAPIVGIVDFGNTRE